MLSSTARLVSLTPRWQGLNRQADSGPPDVVAWASARSNGISPHVRFSPRRGAPTRGAANHSGSLLPKLLTDQQEPRKSTPAMIRRPARFPYVAYLT
jgi:hypothetical protein